MELRSLFQEKYQNHVSHPSIKNVLFFTLDLICNNISTRKAFHLITPFWPFQYNEMMDVLNRKISTFNLKYTGIRWKNLVVSDDLKRHLIDPKFIDYTVLKSSFEREEDYIVFATHGGHSVSIDVLNDLSQQFIQPVMNISKRRSVRFDYTESSDEIEVSLCDDSDRCTMLANKKST